MRDIKYIAIHCTATPQSATVESIKRYWRENLKWKSPGYHYLIEPNGNVNQLQHLDQIANGVAGYNSVSIHISYIGGVDSKNKPLDNRTPQQKQAILNILEELKKKYPKAIIQGHKDFPGVKKACPSFDAKTEYK